MSLEATYLESILKHLLQLSKHKLSILGTAVKLHVVFPKTSPKLGSPLGFGVQGLACELRWFRSVGSRSVPGGLVSSTRNCSCHLFFRSRLRAVTFELGKNPSRSPALLIFSNLKTILV